MAQDIYLKNFADRGFGLVDDASCSANTSIIEQNRRLTMSLPDGLSELLDATGGRYVAFVEVDVRCWYMSAYISFAHLSKKSTHEEHLWAPGHQPQRQ